MQEARRSERVKSFLRAQIIFNQRMSTIDCVVKNISATGAKLALTESIAVPSEFDLYIPQKGRTFRSRIAWRDSTALGVEFLNSNSQAEPVNDVNAYGGANGSLESRLRQLEVQNGELKIRIRELTKRLVDLGQDPNLAA